MGIVHVYIVCIQNNIQSYILTSMYGGGLGITLSAHTLGVRALVSLSVWNPPGKQHKRMLLPSMFARARPCKEPFRMPSLLSITRPDNRPGPRRYSLKMCLCERAGVMFHAVPCCECGRMSSQPASRRIIYKSH